jgi:hypothetical protein
MHFPHMPFAARRTIGCLQQLHLDLALDSWCRNKYSAGSASITCILPPTQSSAYIQVYQPQQCYSCYSCQQQQLHCLTSNLLCC